MLYDEIGSESGRLAAKVLDDPSRVPLRPRLAWRPVPILSVEADEHVGQLAADGLATKQFAKLREVDEPVRVPGGPIVVGAVRDSKDLVMGLCCLMQEASDAIEVGHGLDHTSTVINAA